MGLGLGGWGLGGLGAYRPVQPARPVFSAPCGCGLQHRGPSTAAANDFSSLASSASRRARSVFSVSESLMSGKAVLPKRADSTVFDRTVSVPLPRHCLGTR